MPNPVLDYLIIDGEDVSLNTNYRIYTIDGRQILTGNLDKTKQIDVANLSAGLYLIAINQSDHGMLKIKRFVKN